MEQKIGYVKLNGNRELVSRFDKTVAHDWCGEKIDIASIDIFVRFTVGALGTSKVNGSHAGNSVHLVRNIVFVVTDIKGRSYEDVVNYKSV